MAYVLLFFGFVFLSSYAKHACIKQGFFYKMTRLNKDSFILLVAHEKGDTNMPFSSA